MSVQRMHSLDDFVARSREGQLSWLRAQIAACRAVIADGIGPYGHLPLSQRPTPEEAGELIAEYNARIARVDEDYCGQTLKWLWEAQRGVHHPS